MADYNTMRSEVGARTAQIDEGLRSHMNKVYGTMSVGMLITAMAAWAIAGLATTSDPALAVGQMRNGAMLTGLGVALYTSALKWVVMFAPLAMIFAFGAVMKRASAECCATLFLCICNSDRRFAQLYLYLLHELFHRSNVSRHRNCIRWSVFVGLYNEKRYLRLGIFPNHGCDRYSDSLYRQYLSWLACSDVCNFHFGCPDFCGPHSL